MKNKLRQIRRYIKLLQERTTEVIAPVEGILTAPK